MNGLIPLIAAKVKVENGTLSVTKLVLKQPFLATTTVPRLSCNTAQLHCRGQTITSRYRRTVRREALSPDIRNYIMEQNHRTIDDMETIHWEAHGQALKKNYIYRTFFVKLVHDKLPVGKTIARYKDTYDHRIGFP
jgi:hypothetical protein